MVGQQDSRLLVSQFHHGQLAKFALVAGEGHAVLQHSRVAIDAGQRRQADPPPGRIRLTVDLAQHLIGTPTQGEEGNPFSVQLRKFLVRGQLRVENQFGGRLAGVLLPEPYELENLVGLLAFGFWGKKKWWRGGKLDGSSFKEGEAMCDYSLAGIPNRLAAEGEQLASTRAEVILFRSAGP